MDTQNSDTCFIYNAKNNGTSQIPRGRQLLVHVTSQTTCGRKLLACVNHFAMCHQ